MLFEGRDIYNAIPNRYPLMILQSLEVESDKAIGRVNLKEDDWFFECHYPDAPIFPGCLLVESMTQVFTSILIVSYGVKEIPLLRKIGEISFLSGASVGDIIRIEAVMTKYKRGIAVGYCKAYKEKPMGDVMMAEFEVTEVVSSMLVTIR